MELTLGGFMVMVFVKGEGLFMDIFGLGFLKDIWLSYFR